MPKSILKTDFVPLNIFFIIFLSFWRLVVFLGISFYAFIILSVLGSSSLKTDILAIIIFIFIFLPITLLILFLLYTVAVIIGREVDKNLNKKFKFIFYNIIPSMIFILINHFISAIQNSDQIYYYFSIPLAIFIIYFFDKGIEYINRK
jgi:hypothetical protein